VREWVGQVVTDALVFAVRYDGGGEITLTRDDLPEEGSAAWVVEMLVIALRRTVGLRPRAVKPGQMAPRLWNEQNYNIIRVRSSFLLVASM
jgi:hypothetical protein